MACDVSPVAMFNHYHSIIIFLFIIFIIKKIIIAIIITIIKVFNDKHRHQVPVINIIIVTGRYSIKIIVTTFILTK